MSETNGNGSNGAGSAAKTNEENKVEEVIIVGSGPAGFTAGLYAARGQSGAAAADRQRVWRPGEPHL